MPLEEAEARSLLSDVLREWWAREGRPILGSKLKLRLLDRAPNFDEEALGYRNFAAFVRATDGIAARFRHNTDFLATPVEHAEALEQLTAEHLRIRPDFWQAFVGFAIPDQLRAYEPAHDRIYKGPGEGAPAGAIHIPPIPMQQQLDWRRDFIASLGPEAPLASLLPKLTDDGGFRVFASAIREHPDLHRRWNTLWADEVAAYIRDWARPHLLPDAIWLTQSRQAARIGRETPADLRNRIYALLDTIPIEQLLDLQLPVRWLVARQPPEET